MDCVRGTLVRPKGLDLHTAQTNEGTAESGRLLATRKLDFLAPMILPGRVNHRAMLTGRQFPNKLAAHSGRVLVCLQTMAL